MKKNIINDDQSIDSFFENGLSFPKFIATIFDIDEIPKIINQPKTIFQKKQNNNLALDYLFKNNKIIDQIHPTFDTNKDKESLLSIILTKQCFKIDYDKIIEKCNNCVRPLGIKYNSKNDLLKIENLILFLTILTNGKVQYNSQNQNVSDEILTKIFKDANVPLVINNNSISVQNQYQFFIQIEIIFDIFADQNNIENQELIQSIKSKDNKNTDTNILNNNKDDDNEDNNKHNEEDYDDEYQHSDNHDIEEKNDNDTNNLSSDYEDKSEYSSLSSEYSSYSSEKNKFYIEEENLLKEATLKAINFLGSKGKFHFDTFFNSVADNSLPKFVMYYFHITEIENVNISNTKNDFKDKLSSEEIQNIQAVIEFLIQKNDHFKILYFDFKNPSKIEYSAYLFYSNFLNIFFIENKYEYLYKRCLSIIVEKYDDYNQLSNFSTYIKLLRLLTKGNLHFNYDLSKRDFNDENVKHYFEKAGIPMIINKQLLNSRWDPFPFPVFYQLKFIFDKIDRKPTPLQKIIQIFGTFMQKIISIEYSEVMKTVISLKNKKQSFNFQSEKIDLYLQKAEIQKDDSNNNSFKFQKIINPRINLESVSTFKERQKKLEIKPQNKIESNESLSPTNDKSFEHFWAKQNKMFKCDDGIVYDSTQTNKKQVQTEWITEITNIQKNIKKRDRKSLYSKQKIKIQQSLTFKASSNNFESKFYKIFYYDEQNQKWIYDKDIFSQFSKDKKINVNDSKTPLVLFLDSFENDAISIASNLINGLYPKFDEDDKKDIFVYALTDQSLAMLNYIVDFTNTTKASVKPIFLLLHVSENKRNLPNIHSIIVNIYSFLSRICDLEIVILSKTYYLDQINFIKVMIDLNQIFSYSLEKNEEKKLNSDSENDSSSYSHSDEDYIIYEDEEEDTWEDINNGDDLPKNDKTTNEEIENNNSENDEPKLIIKDPSIIILINDQTIKFCSEIEDNIQNNDFFINLISQINKSTKIHFIDPSNPDTYESFLTSMSDLIIDKNSIYSQIKNNFEHVNELDLKDSYIIFKLINYARETKIIHSQIL